MPYFLRFGLLYGAVSIAAGSVFYILGPDTLYDFRYRIVLFVCIVISMIAATFYARKSSGQIFAFREAFRQSWLTYVAGITMIGVFQFALESFDSKLQDIAKAKAKEELALSARWMRMPEQAVVLEMQKIDTRTKESPGKFVFNTFFSFIFGAVPAFVIALIMRREDKSGPQRILYDA